MKFSDYFEIDVGDEDDWFDPILTADTQLFVDPFRVYVEDDDRWAGAHNKLVEFFNGAMKLIAASNFNRGSSRWKKAERQFAFPEPPEFCLGYGESPFGSGTGAGFGGDMLNGAELAIKAGIEDLAHFEELVLFETGVGPDRIGDIVCNVLKADFVEYTQEVAEHHGIAMDEIPVRHASWDPVNERWVNKRVKLPVNPFFPQIGVLLVPARFLRPLPTVAPGEFWDWAWETSGDQLRGDFSYDIGRSVDAAAIADLARRRPDLANAYLAHLEETGAKPAYDLEIDPGSEYRWYDSALRMAAAVKLPEQPDEPKKFCDWVRKLLEDFAHNIGEQDGWMNLWVEDKPRKERYAQALLRTFVVRVCKDSDVDLTAEANAGRGPVDFKFSKGWSKRALAEVKLTNSTQYWHGLEKQTPQYMKSAQIKCGYFISIGFRDADLERERTDRVREAAKAVSIREGFTVTPIFVDARPKESASKAGRGRRTGR